MVANDREQNARAIDCLREFFKRIGRRRAMVLFIDDLQWGHTADAELLVQLLRQLTVPVLLIVSYRAGDPASSQCLRTLHRNLGHEKDWAGHRVIEVTEMQPDDAQRLAAKLLGTAPDSDIAVHIAKQSQGHPFFVVLYYLLRLRKSAALAWEEWENIGMCDVLRCLIEDLSDDERHLLDIIAVAERPVPETIARGATGLAARFRDVLDNLRSPTVRLLRCTSIEDGGEISFTHDLAREVVQGMFSRPAFVYHLRLAEQYELLARESHRDGLYRLAAGHYEKTGDYRKAAELFESAGEAARERFDFSHAAEMFGRSLAQKGVGGEKARSLRAELARAQESAGHAADAAENYLAVADGPRVGDKIHFMTRAAMCYMISGCYKPGKDVFRDVAKLAELDSPESPWSAAWRLVALRSWLRLRGLGFRRADATQLSIETKNRIDLCWAAVGSSMVEPIWGAYFHARGLLLSLQAGQPYQIARGIATEAAHLAMVGGPDGCRNRRRVDRLLDIAENMARGLPDELKEDRIQKAHAEGVIAFARGVAAYLSGRWDQAIEHCDAAAKTFRDYCQRVSWELITAQEFSLWSLCRAGHLAELSARIPEQLEMARRNGDVYAETYLRTYVGTYASLAAGRPEEASQASRDAMIQWSEMAGEGFHVQHHNATLSEMLIDLYTSSGKTDVAWERISRVWPQYRSSLILRVQQVRIEITYLRACAAIAAATVRERPALLHAAEADARRLFRERMAQSKGLAWLVLGACSSLRETGSSTCDLLRHGMMELSASGLLLHSQAARRRLGVLIGGEEGRDLVRSADAWMQMEGVQDPARMTAMLCPGF